MLGSNFKVVCQYCEEMIDLYDLVYEQKTLDEKEVFDASGSFEMECPECCGRLHISPSATWSFDVDLPED